MQQGKPITTVQENSEFVGKADRQGSRNEARIVSLLGLTRSKKL